MLLGRGYLLGIPDQATLLAKTGNASHFNPVGNRVTESVRMAEFVFNPLTESSTSWIVTQQHVGCHLRLV